MQIAIMYGSYRQGRLGIRVVRHIQRQLQERGHEVVVLDAMEKQLPFLDKRYMDYKPEEAPEVMREISNTISRSDALVIVTGEYNHSVPPGLKNLMDHFFLEYRFRVAGIVSYSAGPIAGMRVAPHLRAICGELGMVTVPTMIGIGGVNETLDETGNRTDGKGGKALEKFVQEIEWYAEALKAARERGLPF